jgi:hypothetical protein
MNSPFRNIPRSGDDVRNLRGWLEDLGRGSGGQSDTMRHSSGIADLRGRRRPLFAEESTGSGLSRYRIEDVKNDYLLARPALPDGTSDTSAAQVKIAKPKNLRYSTWHNLTVSGWRYSVGTGGNTRNVTVNGASGFAVGAGYSEEVRPAYAVGDLIYAAEGDTGLTVLTEVVTLLDVNVDARNWFTTRQQLVGCEWVGNAWVEKRMVVDGGGTY